MYKSIDVVVGGMYGSEAKGHIVQRITEIRLLEQLYSNLRHNQFHQLTITGRTAENSVNTEITSKPNYANIRVIRVAGPNAGHTGYDYTGKPWALRQVPVAAVIGLNQIANTTNQNTQIGSPHNIAHIQLEIAAGSEIDLPVLLDEIDQLQTAGLLGGESHKTLYISDEATMLTDEHKATENQAALVEKIGSTGKGIGAARAARLLRKAQRLADDKNAQNELLKRDGVFIYKGTNPPQKTTIDGKLQPVIIEGTQGYGLGLHAGHYPQCTSSDTRAIDFLAMAGVNPWETKPDTLSIFVVARVYPIRVAGNSGPLKNETTWEELGLTPEVTTVTKKTRRVGQPDWELLAEAVLANGGRSEGHTPVYVALTMVDQKYRELEQNRDNPQAVKDILNQHNADKWFENIENQVGAKIAMFTYGPNHATVRHHFPLGYQQLPTNLLN